MRVSSPLMVLAALVLVTSSPAALPNAPDFDVTPTFDHLGSPDPRGEVVHPDVVHIPGGLSGFTYWMAITPYPDGVDLYENPSILASNDGRNWVVPPGIERSPLVGPPPDGYNNDPDLLYVNGQLILYYNETEREIHNGPVRTTRVKRMTSFDGLDWSDVPETVITADNYPLSPAVVYSGGTYTMWYVYSRGCNKPFVEEIRFRTSLDGRDWSNEETTCTLHDFPVRPWHLDVAKDGSKLKMLYVGYPCDNFALYYAESDDGGMNWYSSSSPVLSKTLTGWDNEIIYRASFIPSGDAMRVWYTARSTGNDWHLGYTETTLLSNAVDPQITPTYDGYGQAIHPDVVHVPGGWNNYAYWMAMTPYTNSNNQVENPSILVSQDGVSWSVPPPLVNPLVPPPFGGGLNHNNDPDLLLVGNTMMLYFNETLTSGVTNVKRMTSTTGTSWSAPLTVLTATNYPLSPAIFYANGQYTMWAVYTSTACGSGTEVIQRRTSSNGTAWSAPTNVTLNGSPAVPWHLNVSYDGIRYRMLYTGYLLGDDCSTMRLYYAESNDGIQWTANPTPLVAPIGQLWDRRMTYRAGFLNTVDQLRVWYSAADPSPSPQWHTGYTSGCIGDCVVPGTTSNLAVVLYRNAATSSWTAPGDDGVDGTATAYDLRYSTAAITELNFNNATPIGTAEPNPPGSFESACTQLAPCTPYWFALKTKDDRGNWSALSNVVAKPAKCNGPFVLCDFGMAMGKPVDEAEDFDLAFDLPRPNPSRDRVTFAFTIPHEDAAREVELSVFDLAGRRVHTVQVESVSPGRTESTWDLSTAGGRRAAPGTYFARLRVGDRRLTRTLILAP